MIRTENKQAAQSHELAENGPYRVDYDTEQESVSTAVVLAICEVAEVDPADFQLYRFVDPDALDSLFTPVEAAHRECGRIELFAHDYRITVTGSGEITVRPDTSESD